MSGPLTNGPIGHGSLVHKRLLAGIRQRSIPISVSFIAREVCNASAAERIADELA